MKIHVFKNSEREHVLILLAAAFLLRITYLLLIRRSPFFSCPVINEYESIALMRASKIYCQYSISTAEAGAAATRAARLVAAANVKLLKAFMVILS